MKHPFAELIGLHFTDVKPGSSRCELAIDKQHLNPHHVAHGAVLYALADTGMGAALYPMLKEGELCATVQITMNYFKPVQAGRVVCESRVINRGKTVAHIESKLTVDDTLVGTASGNFSIFKPSKKLSGE